jgi:CubicO group peptidase (beta-lactamase class C family)
MSVVTIEHLLGHRGGLPHVPPDLVEHVGDDWMSPDLTMPELVGLGAALDAASEDPASPLHAMTQGHDHGLGPVHSVRLGSPSLEHDGRGPGIYAALVVIPDQDVVVAVVTNGGNESPQEVATFSQVVDEAVRAEPEP